ncbi:MAG: YidC/Oxa1 family membrane protein insertase [Clostridia bacterium]|nr:YidC/Oxa1 family membrane protein insertase [Clostridia bacterium]
MTSLVAVPLGYVLEWLYSLLSNYGLAIIVFTLIIRIIIMPLYAAQLKSSRRMMEVQPLVKEIQEKYKGDAAKMNEAMQELYSEHKINPAMGCLPLLIQLPVIWGLFGLLRNPLEYIADDSMILAVHESFFWVTDLGQPDLWVFPILAGVATFISMKLTTLISGQNNSNNPTASSMKMMQYFMPIMIVWMARSMPAGISLYWVVSNIFQIFQIFVMRRPNKIIKEERLGEIE